MTTRPSSAAPGIRTPARATKRTSSRLGARRPHPAHDRIGSWTRRTALLLDARRGHDLLLDGGVALDGRGRLRRDLLDYLGAVAPALGDRSRSLLPLERLVRGHAAEAGARQRGVRAALAVREDRRAAAGELLLGVAAAVGRFGLGLRELRVGLDVDLPTREPRGETGVQALLADRERELVVGDDDGRVARLVVDVDLADARRRQRLGDEARRLRVPRDDVDLLAAELRDDHAYARPARADAGADRVDALGMRLDGDLRAVTGLAGDAAELDEHVVAVAGLLDDAGHDLADAVDVLLVHHLALGLADSLQDDLLRRLRGDAAEVLGRDVLALHEVLGHVRPVDVEVVVGDQRVRTLAGLGLEALELLERALARLVEQALLDVGRQLDREDAELAVVRIEFDGRVARGPGRLLVRGEQRVLERVDERVLLDSLLALDRLDRFDDLSAHVATPRRSCCPARCRRTG